MTVPLIAGVGIHIIHVRKNAQTIFTRHISGWTYVATHRFLLAVEVAIAVVVAVRIPVEVRQRNREIAEFEAAGLPAPFPRSASMCRTWASSSVSPPSNWPSSFPLSRSSADAW